MSVTGLHLHDAALAVASDGGLVSIAPSIVHADPAHPELTGSPARDIARLSPRLVSSEHWATLARDGARTDAATLTIARAELRGRLDAALRGQALQCVVSAAFPAESLGVVLALARLEGIDIAGFHDSASLTSASLGMTGTTVVLEIGLAHAVASRVEHTGDELRRRAAVVRRGPGLLALRQAWLRMIGEAMVLQTRFDPLHDGASEQRLHDLLDDAAAAAATAGSAIIELPTGREPARVVVSRDQFVETAADIWREVLAAVHELRPAGARINVLMDETLLRLPGLAPRLAELRGSRLFVHTSGLPARAVSLAIAPSAASDGVTLQRGHALAVPLEPVREIDRGEFAMFPETPPTHALLDGRAYALPRGGTLEIGRTPSAGGIRLAEGLAGVSRLHCSLRSEADEVILVPHSSQGVWLNDERVSGRLRVCSGDRLRIGTPGVAIEFIAVGGAGSGAAQG